MKRSTFLTLCFYATLLAVGAAMIIKIIYEPPGPGGRGGGTFALLSPIFFVMAAKKATRFGKAAIVLALIGFLFGAFGLWASVQKMNSETPAGINRGRG